MGCPIMENPNGVESSRIAEDEMLTHSATSFDSVGSGMREHFDLRESPCDTTRTKPAISRLDRMAVPSRKHRLH